MEPKAAQRLAIVGGTALIGRDLEPSSAALVIEGSTIAQITSDTDAPTVIDATGHTVIPGFIDAHVHIAFADPRDVLRRGVTTVRDLAWPRDEIYPLARASLGNDFDGPLILTVGPMVTVEGGYPLTAGWAPPGTGLAVSSPDDARAAVATLASDGVAAIKVALNPPAGKVLDDTTLATIVSAAHDHDLRVTAHIHGLEELSKALAAGVDELAHMLMSPEELTTEVIDRLIQNDVTIVPTLSIFPRGDVEIAVANLGRFVAAGGRVIYGTDLGNAGPQPGIDELEVTRMEAAGMSVVDIVRSATVDAAAYLGLDAKGVIAPGMDADLVMIEGELEGAADLTRVRRVLRGGRDAA